MFTSVMKFSLKKEKESIKSLKNLHRNKRCFVIGNGPSLSVKDLDLIKDEITFSCNMIFDLLDKTSWKPYYYFCHDPGYVNKFDEKIKRLPAKQKIVGYYYGTARKVYYTYRNKIADHIYYINKINDRYDNIQFSFDISKQVEACGSVSYAMLQFAVYMGFKEIYLIGFDHNLNSKTEVTHFEGYSGNKVNFANMDNLTRGFVKTREACDHLNIKIANCTRGGKLEVFKREELEEVIKVDRFQEY